MNETVSVVIPCHNRIGHVQECLASVVAQTYRPIQVIIVDDASTEPVLPAAEELLTARAGITFDLLTTPANFGPGTARELGRKQATGGYVCYLDSDDLWHPNKLATQVERLRASGSEMCYTAVRVFCHSPDEGTSSIRPRSDETFDSILPALLYGRPWATGAVMWTSAAVARIGPWLPEWWWEDYAYDCRAACVGVTIAHCPEALTFQRRNPDGLHLSDRPSPRLVGSRARCIIATHHELAQAGRLSDAKIRRRIGGLALRVAYDCDDTGNASERSSLLRALSAKPYRTPTRLLAQTILLAKRLLPPSLFRRTRERAVGLFTRFESSTDTPT